MNSIPAGQQFAAIAWLRWRLFANGFRRKGGAGELVARIIVFPFGGLFVLGPILGAAAAAYGSARSGNLEFMAAIFWGIFVLQILVSINISPPGLSFDPESLIRYPLSFPRYLAVRLVLGLLSVSTIVGTLALLASAAAVWIARPSLGPTTLAAAVALALCNMLFIRTLFAWIDRWLSTRRARELFTALIFVFSIGIQYANVTFNNLGHHSSLADQRAKLERMLRLYHRFEPYLHSFPPGLASQAIQRRSQLGAFAGAAFVAGILAFAAACLAIFAWRMRREYRGESLSEAAGRAPAPAQRTPPARPSNALTSVPPQTAPILSPVAAACFEKEWIYVRRNPAQFYGLVAPLAMVFLFAGRLGSFARTGMVFPAAVAYSVLGIAALAYNALGLDASGVQFYFLAPIPLRSVMLGKNLFSFAITAAQLVLVYAVIALLSGPPPILIVLSTLCWVVFACLVNATIGNMRSITAPKRIDPSKISRKQASQLSALMCVGIMMAVGAMGVGLISLARFAGIDWLPVPILLALAAGAFALYMAGLNRIDAMALNHRETLIEELCKAS